MPAVTVESLRNSKGFCIPHTSVALPEYTNWREEQMASKKTVCIGSWSFATRQHFEGSGVIQLLKDHSVNSLEKFAIGQAKHLIACNESGKVITEGIILKVAEEKFYIYALRWWAYIASLNKYKDVSVHFDSPGTISIYQVAGPNSIYLLEEAANESLRDIKFMHFRNIKIGGIDVLAINGITMAGEIGFELQYPAKYDKDVYNTIMKTGEKYGIRALGFRSHQINHLEACFPTVGFHYLPAMLADDQADFRKYLGTLFGSRWKLSGSYEGKNVKDYYRSPVEMGWIKNINFDHDFLGREALEKEVKNPKRKVVTLEFNKEDVIDVYASYFEKGEPYEFMNIPHQYQQICETDTVTRDGKFIGTSTNPGYSYYFRKILALAYIDIKHAEPGTNIEVLWGNPGMRQKIVRGTVARAPYKEDKRRTNLNTLPKKLIVKK